MASLHTTTLKRGSASAATTAACALNRATVLKEAQATLADFVSTTHTSTFGCQILYHYALVSMDVEYFQTFTFADSPPIYVSIWLFILLAVSLAARRADPVEVVAALAGNVAAFEFSLFLPAARKRRSAHSAG